MLSTKEKFDQIPREKIQDLEIMDLKSMVVVYDKSTYNRFQSIDPVIEAVNVERGCVPVKEFGSHHNLRLMEQFPNTWTDEIRKFQSKLQMDETEVNYWIIETLSTSITHPISTNFVRCLKIVPDK